MDPDPGIAPAGSWARGTLPRIWAVLLALLVLGPALGPGQVLSYDMVWVPDLRVTSDALGLGTALPRTVPSDAVVAVLDNLIPGSLLQKAVLLGSLIGAGLGMLALLRHTRPESGTAASLVAVTVAEWNPFVAERLLIGHWPVLLGYAALPWVLLLGSRCRAEGRVPLALLPTVLVGSLSASTGLVTAIALMAVALGPRWPVTARLTGLVAAADAPWLMAGLLHGGSATSSGVGAEVFATHAEGRVPAPLAALTLGGIWNIDVVPSSRQGILGWCAVVAVIVAIGVAGRSWWRGTPRRDAGVITGLAAGSWIWAVLTWLVPGVSGFLAGQVPGGGLLRDGSRGLALMAPALALLSAEAATVALRRLRRTEVGRELAGPISVFLILLPMGLLPDLVWGGGNALRTSHYPASWTAAAEAAGMASDESPGRTLVLPWSSYRAPSWNRGRPVLDPMPRLIGGPVLSSDVLSVSGRIVPGEDPTAAAAGRALASDDPTPALRALGIGRVLVEADPDPRTRTEVSRLDGEVRYRGGGFQLIDLGGSRDRPVPIRDRVVMSLAWTAWGATGLLGLVVGVLRGWAGRRPRRPFPR